MTALFDMDGTLFPGDSQLRFARFIQHRHFWRRIYLLPLLPVVVLRACGAVDTDYLKRAFLSITWGMSAEQLDADCAAFVQQELLPAMYPEVKERLLAHQAAGDTTVLCSASPGWWTRHMGRALGFNYTLGTPMETGDSVPLMPAIGEPGNNKGQNKVTRLRNLAITKADVAYTDSAADEPMMGLCEKAVLVCPKDDFRARHPKAEVLDLPAGRKCRGPLFILRCLLGL